MTDKHMVTGYNELFCRYLGNEKTVTLPAGTTEIDSFAFFNNMVIEEVIFRLRSYKIVDIKIGEFAFYNCPNLKRIKVEKEFSGTKINVGYGSYSFSQCSNLIEIFESDYVSIGNNAFEGCISLERINGNIEKIGDEAFKSCSSLKTFSSLSIGPVIIGDSIFENCTNLEIIHIWKIQSKNTNPIKNFTKNCKSLKHLNLPQGKYYISQDSIEGSDNLQFISYNSLDLSSTYRKYCDKYYDKNTVLNSPLKKDSKEYESLKNEINKLEKWGEILEANLRVIVSSNKSVSLIIHKKDLQFFSNTEFLNDRNVLFIE